MNSTCIGELSMAPNPDAMTTEPAIPSVAIRPREGWGRRVRRTCINMLALASLGVILLIVTPLTTVLFDALGSEDPLEQADYIVCLGGDNARIIESTRLLKEGYAGKLIVTSHGTHAAEMRDLAIEWGADPSAIVVDSNAVKTRNHPTSIKENLGVNPETARLILVTNFTHLGRSRACFEKAGYRHLIMREPRWERTGRPKVRDWKWRFRVLPDVIYEYTAWLEYWIRGVV